MGVLYTRARFQASEGEMNPLRVAAIGAPTLLALAGSAPIRVIERESTIGDERTPNKLRPRFEEPGWIIR